MILPRQITALRPQTTAHLAQTMTLLELTSEELRQKVESELASNPALELASEARCPTCHRLLATPGRCPVCSRPVGMDSQPVVFVSPREDFNNYSRGPSPEELPDDEWGAAEEDLPEYVLRQIAAELPVEDRPVAAHILTSLDEDGLLTVSLVEIARYNHVLPSRVERVLNLIQHADPLGVGSPTPKDAMLVQLEALSEIKPAPMHTKRAIQEGMDLLSHHAYTELGHKLGISTSKVMSIVRYIADNLYPYPARPHWGDRLVSSDTPRSYHRADILISRIFETPNTPLMVEIASPYAGRLQVNPLFRQALNQAPEDKIDSWQGDLEQASLLVKCLQQRDHTLVRLMQRLVVLQREFILRGDAYIQPLTRARLAVELDVHESTISRAVSGKAVQLPNGRIVPLSRWFDRSLHIRTALRNIIEKEARPLSDTELSDRLNAEGFAVARRTVAKYRAMEGILPARLRQPQVVYATK